MKKVSENSGIVIKEKILELVKFKEDLRRRKG
jgi:hypothetical protein